MVLTHVIVIYVGAEKKKYLQASAADNKLDFVVVFLSRAELLRRRRRRRRETEAFCAADNPG